MNWITKLTGRPKVNDGEAVLGKGFGTLAVHAGVETGSQGEVMTGISVSTTFRQTSPGVPIGVFSFVYHAWLTKSCH